ncbi:MAG: SBBP repeat-containing protein [Acidobacteriota bacterium]
MSTHTGKTPVLIMILFTAAASHAGVQREWVQTYQGPGDGLDVGVRVALDRSGDAYVGGYSQGESGHIDYVVLKYGSGGSQLWVQRYSDPNGYDAYLADMAVDAQGNVYVTGSSQRLSDLISVGDASIVTAKYDANGNRLWVARFDGGRSSLAFGNVLAVDRSGNVYVAGTLHEKAGGSMRTQITLKYDSDGHKQWVRSSLGLGNAIALDPRGGSVFVAGLYEDPVGSTYRGRLVINQYSLDGARMWKLDRPDSFNDWDAVKGMVVSRSKYVVVCGRGRDGYLGTTARVVGFHLTDARYWFEELSSGTLGYEAIALSANDRVVLAGFDGLCGSGQGSGRMLMCKIPLNNPIGGWLREYSNPNGCAEAHAIATDAKGDIYAGGSIEFDVGTLKVDGVTGKRIWAKRQPATASDMPFHFDTASSVAVDPTGNVFVAGRINSHLFSDEGDIVLIKYSQPAAYSAEDAHTLDSGAR